MVWNKTNPGDSEAIRNLGTVIRPNWVALEEGSNGDTTAQKLKYWSLNLYSRDDVPGPISDDADTVTDGIAIFSKTDADTGQPEIYVVHEDSTVDQWIKGPANIAPASRTTNGETSIFGGLLVKFATIGAMASNTEAYLWEGVATSNQLGLTDFPNTCFGVWLVKTNNSSNSMPNVSSVTASGFTIQAATSGISLTVFAIGN